MTRSRTATEPRAPQARAVATREKILSAAAQLLAAKGYHDTKLDEVLQAAGVTSGAFFHHFAGKEELGFAVLDWYLARRRAELEQIERDLPSPADDPLAPAFRWLDATAERFRRRARRKQAGCIFGNLSTSLSDTHPGFRRRLAECLDQMALDFQARLQPAAQHCSKPVDTLALSRYIVALLEGSILMARAQHDPEYLARHFSLLKDHLRHVFNAADAR
jgi:TetR/AcrR family transcriptional repressor of nem operon